jgi:polygalacturonase
MINEKGLRGRGKLISIMNCNNFNIQGLTIEESPCWTIHYVFSKNVTCHDLNILSTAHNGDGIDPDSSLDSYIFNCTFSTNDDCIAIKSGKNPEGNKVNIPCENIYISDCSFLEGHSLAIGSEVSGGVKNVCISNCKLGDLRFGLQIKTTDKRGGYVKNVDVSNCDLNQIKIVTSVKYNNDGEAAPDFTLLSDFSFRNINMANSKRQDIIVVEGFKNGSDNLNNVKFKDIRVPIKSVISISNASNISIQDITSVSGQTPDYIIEDCTINNLKILQ